MNSVKTASTARLYILFSNAEPVDASRLEKDLARMHGNASIRYIKVQDADVTQIDIGGQIVEMSEPEGITESVIADLCKNSSRYSQKMLQLDGSFDNVRQIKFKSGQAPPILQMMLLTFTAFCLKEQGATAILNPDARTSMPLDVVDHLEEGIFSKFGWFDIYTGLCKNTIDGKLFYSSKGNTFWGFPEFAIYPKSEMNEESLATLETVFDYLGQNEVGVKADDTMQMDEKTIKFRDATQEELKVSGCEKLMVVEDLTEATSLLELAGGLIKQKDYDHALELLNQCLAADPKFVDALYARATLALTLEKGEQALADFETLSVIDTADHMALVGKANAFSMIGDFANAQKAAAAAIKLAPKYSGAQIASGLAYIGSQDYEKALETLTAAIKLDDQNAQVYYLRSRAYLGLGQDDKAKKDEELASVLGFKQ